MISALIVGQIIQGNKIVSCTSIDDTGNYRIKFRCLNCGYVGEATLSKDKPCNMIDKGCGKRPYILPLSTEDGIFAYKSCTFNKYKSLRIQYKKYLMDNKLSNEEYSFIRYINEQTLEELDLQQD